MPRSKLLRILSIILLCFVGVIGLLYATLHSSKVQTVLTQEVGDMLSKKLDASFTVEEVDVGLYKSVILRNVLIKDQSNDTLFAIYEVIGSLNSFSIDEHILDFERITISKARCNLHTDSNKVSNIRFLINALQRKDSSSISWNINCSNFSVLNSTLEYKHFDAQRKDSGINFKDLLITNVNADIINVELGIPKYTFAINKLSLNDKSGFELSDLTSKVTIDSSYMHLTELLIMTPQSNIVSDDLGFAYDKISDFKSFNTDVRLNATLDNSIISFSDLAFFVPKIKEEEEAVALSGAFRGSISDLRCKDLNVKYGTGSSLKGQISISGLPNVKDAFIFASIDEFETSKSDIERINFKIKDKQMHITFPKYLTELEHLSYKGKVTGFVNDFVAYGTWKTNLGTLSSDISLKRDSVSNDLSFNGKIETDNLDLGKIVKLEEQLGRLGINANIKGRIYQENKIEAFLDGVINSLAFYDYNYQNIKIEGDISNRKFDGALLANDPNLEMEFLGRFDYTQSIPVFDFTVDVKKMNLFKLHLDRRDTISDLNFLLTANFIGDELDDVSGKIDLFDVELIRGSKELNVKEIFVESYKTEAVRTIKLKSDVVDADVEGNYEFRSLYKSFKYFIYQYVPSLSNKEIVHHQKHHFTFNVFFKQPKQLSDVFFPKIYFAPKTIIYGEYNANSKVLNLIGDLPDVKIAGSRFKEFQIYAETKDSLLNISIKTDKLDIKNKVELRNISINSSIHNNSADVEITWDNQDTNMFSGFVGLNCNFSKGRYKYPKAEIEMRPSYISMSDKIWRTKRCALYVDSSYIHFDTLDIINDDQKLSLFGDLSRKVEDTIFVKFDNLNIGNVNGFMKNGKYQLGGLLNGNTSITNVYENIRFFSELEINSMSINNDIVGDVYLSSNWMNSEKKFYLKGYSDVQSNRSFDIAGSYAPYSKNIDFALNVNKLDLRLLETFFNRKVSDVKGLASGKIILSGNVAKPVVDGKVKLSKAAFTVDYLKTRYFLSDYVNFTNDKIWFKDVSVYDTNGNPAIAHGSISHETFRNFVYDINIITKDFLLLNTKEEDNELYYGKALANGLINIKGTKKNLQIDVVASTARGTEIYIPLEYDAEVEKNDFISFITTDQFHEFEKEEYEVDLSGIELKMDLEVTHDAFIELIFDSKVGDVIKGTGAGNIKMEINTLGAFNMFGEFEIDKGDYLFTLQNVINKKFDIEKGGTITWGGDPYDANININAVYRLKTSLYNLTLDSTNKHRVPVECHLIMTDKLMNPVIDFDIELPIIDDEAQTIISSLTPDELNKQILSLLVLSNFYTPDQYVGGQNSTYRNTNYGMGYNSSELLSNQLSHWLSQISDDFDVGVNYRPGDEITSDEIEVALSTQILNDRVSINGNVGVGEHQTTSNIVGDFKVDVKINKNGKLRVKGYTRANDELVYESSPYTQGLGIYYKEDFNTVKELWQKYWKILTFQSQDKEQSD